MQSFLYVVLFVVATTGPLVYYHFETHGVINWMQVALALFMSVNILICIWEIGLFVNRKLIKSQYLSMKRKYGGNLPAPIFMFEHVPLLQALTLKHWALVWSTYSLMDPSYSETTSFGFAIDVGNGFVTLLPSALYALCMTWDLIPARIMGVIGIILNYQMMYGTFVYYFSYVINERYKGRPFVTVVSIANSFWVLGPLLGMYVAYDWIMSNSYAIVRNE